MRIKLSHFFLHREVTVAGAIFGGFGALRMGMRGGELVQNVGKVMVQGGGTFGTFMSIGTAIRC